MQEDVLQRREAAGESDDSLRVKKMGAGAKALGQRRVGAREALVEAGEGDRSGFCCRFPLGVSIGDSHCLAGL